MPHLSCSYVFPSSMYMSFVVLCLRVVMGCRVVPFGRVRRLASAQLINAAGLATALTALDHVTVSGSIVWKETHSRDGGMV